MAYTGTSIVDYLKSVGQASDYNSRAALAQQKGISNYAGTAEQNTQLLNLLRTVPAPTTPTTTPIPTTTPTPAPTTTSNPTASIPGLTPYLQNQLKNLIPTQPVQQPPQPQQPVQQSVQQPQVNQEDIIKQINEAKAKVADLQAQDEALKKYGVADTEQLSKDESGSYTPTKESSTIQGLIDSISDLTATGATKSLSDIVSEISTAMGLTDVSKQISDLDTQYADDVMEVNDNPWISEGLRSKKISLLQDKYDTKKNALIQQLSSQNETIGKAIDYYYKEQDYKKDLLSLQLDAKLKMMDQEIELYKAGQSDLDTSITEVNGRKILINNQTGEIIKDLGAATSGTTGGLTQAQINQTVNSIAGAFDNETIVKNYNTAMEGYQTLKSIGVNTKSPADDIAFIYAFAKIMDPNSVVREGEYNTIQQYAQTWADTFGFKAKRIFSNTNFLSSDAKQKMMNALSAKVDTITKQYQQVSSEYQRQINDALSGKPRTITNYSISADPTQELRDDILSAKQKNDYGTREQLGTRLSELYPELSPLQIQNKIYELIPDIK